MEYRRPNYDRPPLFSNRNKTAGIGSEPYISATNHYNEIGKEYKFRGKGYEKFKTPLLDRSLMD